MFHDLFYRLELRIFHVFIYVTIFDVASYFGVAGCLFSVLLAIGKIGDWKKMEILVQNQSF